MTRLLPLLGVNQSEAIRVAALRALSRFDDPSTTAKLLAEYPAMPTTARSASREVLFSRASSASAFLDWAEANPDLLREIPLLQVRLVARLESKELNARVRKIWGNVGQGTAEEKLANMRRINNDLRAAPGSAKDGERVYNQLCSRCHKLFGSGGDLGMDLTNANRSDRNYLLTHIVDPSVYIRKEYMTYEVRTRNGRVQSGLMSEQDAASLTLMDRDYRKMRIPRADISTVTESPDSMMPEGLLDQLKPQQVRDLFAFLQSPSKL